MRTTVASTEILSLYYCNVYFSVMYKIKKKIENGEGSEGGVTNEKT